MGNGSEQYVGQTTMASFIVTEEQADKIDSMKSRYFKVGSNMEYRLEFSTEPIEDKDSPDGKCITGRLIKKMSPVWKEGKDTGAKEEAVMRQMTICKLNGEACEKIWNIKSAKMREIFRPYAENGLLGKKIFLLKIKGELKDCDYMLTPLDK